jgi:hypothetical protein
MGWVVSVMPRPRFTPGESTSFTHCTGGWVGHRTGLDTGTRRKILCPCRGSNLDCPIVQSVVRHYTGSATRLQLIRGTAPIFTWGDWGKPQKPSVSIIGLRAEILTRDLPNTKQEWIISRSADITLQDTLYNQRSIHAKKTSNMWLMSEVLHPGCVCKELMITRASCEL